MAALARQPGNAMTRPLRSGPTTGLSSLSRVAPPLCPALVLRPSRLPRLGRSLRIGTTGSKVPCGNFSGQPWERGDPQSLLRPGDCAAACGLSPDKRNSAAAPEILPRQPLTIWTTGRPRRRSARRVVIPPTLLVQAPVWRVRRRRTLLLPWPARLSQSGRKPLPPASPRPPRSLP